MPEGPEIRRAADRLAAAIQGRTAERVYFGLERLKAWEETLTGRAVERVETRGKGMLLHLAGSLVVFSHNQLYGRWYVRRPGSLPRTRRQLRFAIHTHTKSALLYSASTIDVLTEEALGDHPFLAGLGPDVLDRQLTAATVAARLEDTRFRGRRLGGLLLDQSFVAGLGNYLRCEILHAAGLHPGRRARDLSPEQIARVAHLVLAMPRLSYRTGGITNDEARAGALKAAGETRSRYRHLAFRRAGRPCYGCGAPLVAERHDGRRCDRCPACQPE